MVFKPQPNTVQLSVFVFCVCIHKSHWVKNRGVDIIRSIVMHGRFCIDAKMECNRESVIVRPGQSSYVKNLLPCFEL